MLDIFLRLTAMMTIYILFSEESSMLLRYIESAVKKAKYKILENGVWFAEIPGYPGVWSNGRRFYANISKNVLRTVQEKL